MWSTWWSRRQNASSYDPERKALSARVEARMTYFTRGRVTRRARGEKDDGLVMRAILWLLAQVVGFMQRHRF